MPLHGIGLLVPEWLEIWLAIAAAVAAIAGLPPRIVLGFAAAPAFHWVIGPALQPWFVAQPIAVQAGIMLVVLLMAMQAGLTMLFGKEPAGHFVGTMLVRIFDQLAFATFRGLGWMARAPRMLR
ncbi:MAG: hypothetical protein ACREFP_07310 [Acetobacteraceae bacterium]